MTNPLQMIPVAVRRWLYLGVFLAGVVLGALQAYGLNVAAEWRVLAYVGPALGLVAMPNAIDVRKARRDAKANTSKTGSGA